MIDGTPIGAFYGFRFRLPDLLANGNVTLNYNKKNGLHAWRDRKGLVSVDTDRQYVEALDTMLAEVAAEQQVGVDHCKKNIKGVEAQFAAVTISIINRGSPRAAVVDAQNLWRGPRASVKQGP